MARDRALARPMQQEWVAQGRWNESQDRQETTMNLNFGKNASLIAGFGVGATLGMLLEKGREPQGRRGRDPRRNHRLAARVCAELDEEVEHARGIQVFADNSQVTLRGIALRDELDDVLSTVRNVNGVRAVRSELEVRDKPGKVAALQT